MDKIYQDKNIYIIVAELQSYFKMIACVFLKVYCVIFPTTVLTHGIALIFILTTRIVKRNPFLFVCNKYKNYILLNKYLGRKSWIALYFDNLFNFCNQKTEYKAYCQFRSFTHYDFPCIVAVLKWHIILTRQNTYGQLSIGHNTIYSGRLKLAILFRKCIYT